MGSCLSKNDVEEDGMVRLLVATGAGGELLLRFVLLRAWQRKMLRLRYRAPQPAGHRLRPMQLRI